MGMPKSVFTAALVYVALLGAEPMRERLVASGRPIDPATPRPAAPPAPHAARIASTLDQLPLAFEPNVGQTDPRVRFLARCAGYTLLLRADEALMLLRPGASGAASGPGAPDVGVQSAVLRLRLMGANPEAQGDGGGRLKGQSNYFIGRAPSEWHTGVPNYADVTFNGIYPGIDVRYHGRPRQLEYDFIIAHGADPRRIVMAFEGARVLRLDADGRLIVDTRLGEVVQKAPVIYQEHEGYRHEVPGGYIFLGEKRVGFRVGQYDRTRPLVVDPVLGYSTYYGGTGGDQARGIAVDGLGQAHVVGLTESVDLRLLLAYRDFHAGGSLDVFVLKLDETGSEPLFATYFGGRGSDRGFAIALDLDGDIWITGDTDSIDLPTTSDLLGTGGFGGGPSDAFVAEFAGSGTTLLFSTYFGLAGEEHGYGIAVDFRNDVTFVGSATGSRTGTLATSGAFQTAAGGGFDAFVARLDDEDNRKVTLGFSTYFGAGADQYAYAVATDSHARAIFTGAATGPDGDIPTTPNAFAPSDPGVNFSCADNVRENWDAYVAVLEPDGATLSYSTYLGGECVDAGYGVAVDDIGRIYVTGETGSLAFPTTTGAFQTVCGNNPMSPDPVMPFVCLDAFTFTDAFVAKLDQSQSGPASLLFSTYLGGRGGEVGTSIAVGAARTPWVTGLTGSPLTFPIVVPFQPSFGSGLAGGGDIDAFVAKLDTTGEFLLFASFLGAESPDIGFGIALDNDGSAYVTGVTDSMYFPTAGYPGMTAMQSGPPAGESCTPSFFPAFPHCNAFVTKIVTPLSIRFGPPFDTKLPTLGGGAVPIKVGVFQPNGVFANNAAPTLAVFKHVGADLVEITPTPAGKSNEGNTFRFDLEGEKFIYNLSLGGYSSGHYIIRVMLIDGTSVDAAFVRR